MKFFVVSVLCLWTTFAYADEFRFRGDLVETYMAEKGFLGKIPPGTRLNCEDAICSYQKSVRIYVFKNREGEKLFWSTDLVDVVFDEPQLLSTCGRKDNIVHYDETGQLLYREKKCDEAVGHRVGVRFPALALK